MEHFPASLPVFVRQKRKFFAERNFLLAAKTKISCRKEIHGRVESGEKRGFGRLFPSNWRLFACKIHLSFCGHFPHPADAGAAPVRTAARGGRQNVAGTRLPAFILHSCGPARFAYFRPSRPCSRPRDSREAGFDVLTKWNLEFPAALQRMIATKPPRGRQSARKLPVPSGKAASGPATRLLPSGPSLNQVKVRPPSS